MNLDGPQKRKHDGRREIQLYCWNRNRHSGPDELDACTAVLVPRHWAGQFEYPLRLSKKIT